MLLKFKIFMLVETLTISNEKFDIEAYIEEVKRSEMYYRGGHMKQQDLILGQIVKRACSPEAGYHMQ